MTLQEFLEETYDDEIRIRPPVVCEDGFTISIQGSDSHYCVPKQNGSVFKMLEVSCDYAEILQTNSVAHTTSIYGFVPVDLVEQLIADHGGIAMIDYNY